jgi:hypothetical protein
MSTNAPLSAVPHRSYVTAVFAAAVLAIGFSAAASAKPTQEQTPPRSEWSAPSGGAGVVTNPVDQPLRDADVLIQIDRPRGKSQTSKATTTLLNRFSELGFSDVREFRRDGDSYVALATNPQGRPVTVFIDPAKGMVAAQQ